MILSRIGKIFFNTFPFFPGILLLITFCTREVAADDKPLLNILSGKYNASQIADYRVVPPEYAMQSALYMHEEALNAFIKMAAAAKKDGFHIYINSAIRDFSTQKYIWEAKFNGQRPVEGKDLKKTISGARERALKILEYSSMPGTSRHHWGSDIDLGYNKNVNQMLTNEAFESGEGLRFYDWMKKHALEYGFCQPYKDSFEKRNQGIFRGYHEEKWHWSYKPLSVEYLKAYLKSANQLVPSGFEGSKVGEEFYLDYVKNIHADCR